MMVLTPDGSGAAAVTAIDFGGTEPSGYVEFPTNQTSATGAASFVDLADATYLVWGSDWWTVDTTQTDPVVAPIDAPVDDGMGAAGSPEGVVVLTATDMIHLDSSLAEIRRVSWTAPPRYGDSPIRQMISDGGGGLYVALSEPRGGYGGVMHISADGATSVVVDGSKPTNADNPDDCHDAETDALDANLGSAQSIALWQGRILVADYECNSVLQTAAVS